MAWVRLDDSIWDHPKLIGASLAVRGLHASAICWCNRYLTDGFVADGFVTRENATAEAEALVAGEAWDRVEGGYMIHDYLEYQPSREKVLGDREAESNRKREAREKGHTKNVRAESSRTNTGRNTDDEGTFVVPTPTPTPMDVEPDGSTSTALATFAIDFDAFWRAYPRRDGRKAAEAKWKVAIRRTEPLVIIAAAERYRNDPNRTEQYTKQAATWLHGECWNDGPLPGRSTPESSITRAIRLANSPTWSIDGPTQQEISA